MPHFRLTQSSLPPALLSLLLPLFVAGCGQPAPAPQTTQTVPAAESRPVSAEQMPQSTPAAERSDDPAAAVSDEFDFKPLSASALTAGDGNSGAAGGGGVDRNVENQIKSVMQKLKPLQVMLGQWRGTTRREYEGFKAVDSHEWIWDLQTEPARPALVMTSDKSPYLKKARLTWNPTSSQFELTATDPADVTRHYAGDYTDPVHEVVGPDDKMHRVFRLELTQTDQSAEEVGGERWQFAFAQQENNRYLLEIGRRRGSAAFARYDTVSTQREGTSFAVSDTDYGEKECIISQGLGTISVSYKGRTYWVCCTGCKAAFEEDPETWIARASARAAKK